MGGVGGSPNGVVHNLLMQFFTPYSSKIEVSENYFFDIVTTHSDQPKLCKACFRPYLGVFHPIWGLGVGHGVTQWSDTQPAYAVFHPVQKANFPKLIFLTS